MKHRFTAIEPEMFMEDPAVDALEKAIGEYAKLVIQIQESLVKTMHDWGVPLESLQQEYNIVTGNEQVGQMLASVNHLLGNLDIMYNPYVESDKFYVVKKPESIIGSEYRILSKNIQN